MSLPRLFALTNTHLLSNGQSQAQDIYFSPDTGLITPNYTRARPDIDVTRIDLKGQYVVAPGYLELQINGLVGVHFTRLGREDDVAGDEANLKKVARELAKKGVTGWWATVPTVAEERWQEILPRLKPRAFDRAATLLGAHVEGPYLHPTKHGAHDASFFKSPATTPPGALYGEANLREVVKYITIAPELPSGIPLIQALRQQHPDLVISLGHSCATYAEGQAALEAGARSLTHLYNAMSPLHHRDPGLVGLVANNASTAAADTSLAPAPEFSLLSSTMTVDAWLARNLAAHAGSSSSSPAGAGGPPECYFSVIPDLVHVHPAVLAMAHRAAPRHCVLVTDAIELAGLPDGVYPPNDQVTVAQVKSGHRATVQGTDTLIGSCVTLDECVRNMVRHAGCSLAEAVRCVTENAAGLMGRAAQGRGRLDIGCRADFAVLDREGNVVQTWIGGVKIWDRDEETGLGEG